ncbi:MAG: hypothetical protein BGO43_12385 [Gammaproteobacteria bacterium 39-13]|nr:hypothetical protein [Gammaproteobacteria bacterium]OJV93296.1 MAG: hypothetical protein BGO43_12385 [Gammaproteobacteria bacterium 39-13]
MHPQKYIYALLNNGFTEHWIAKKVKLAQSTIHRIKVGDVRSPRFDTVEKIKKLYEKQLETSSSNA